MRDHTDSQTIVYHEDGSWTTTTVNTEFPATKAEKATAWGVLGACTLLTVSPLIVLGVQEWRESRRIRKEQLAQSEETD